MSWSQLPSETFPRPPLTPFPRSGNPLASLFPTSGSLAPSEPSTEHPAGNPNCTWGLCSSRWQEALEHSRDHPEGERIVPRVVLEATHQRALRDGGIKFEDLQRFAVGGSGETQTHKAGSRERPGR